jgi:2-C-methyl-D-erythritol 4-phosphate cytidylyltransferase
MKKIALVVAGGQGLRMGGPLPKQFMLLGGQPILMHTLTAFSAFCDETILVLPVAQLEYWGKLCTDYDFRLPHKMALGGSTRFQSVYSGLALVPHDALVAIHDGVRPLVTQTLIENSFKVAAEKQSAIACVALKDSIRHTHSGAVDRNAFKAIQTPQTFQSNAIKDAYDFFAHIDPEGDGFTDDASVFEKAGYPITLIEGSYRNIKITTPEDMLMAEALFKNPLT